MRKFVKALKTRFEIYQPDNALEMLMIRNVVTPPSLRRVEQRRLREVSVRCLKMIATLAR